MIQIYNLSKSNWKIIIYNNKYCNNIENYNNGENLEEEDYFFMKLILIVKIKKSELIIMITKVLNIMNIFLNQ